MLFSLAMDGCETACAGTKREGMEQLKKSRYDLVLLDCNLPDGAVWTCARRSREYGTCPFYGRRQENTEMDRGEALELGAADFMSKPFSLAVLKARIRKILQSAQQGSRLISGGILIDRDACRVSGKDGEIPLSGSNTSCFCILWRTGPGARQRTDPLPCVGQPGKVCG